VYAALRKGRGKHLTVKKSRNHIFTHKKKRISPGSKKTQTSEEKIAKKKTVVQKEVE